MYEYFICACQSINESMFYFFFYIILDDDGLKWAKAQLLIIHNLFSR